MGLFCAKHMTAPQTSKVSTQAEHTEAKNLVCAYSRTPEDKCAPAFAKVRKFQRRSPVYRGHRRPQDSVSIHYFSLFEKS